MTDQPALEAAARNLVADWLMDDTPGGTQLGLDSLAKLKRRIVALVEEMNPIAATPPPPRRSRRIPKA